MDYYLLVHNVKWISEWLMEHHCKCLNVKHAPSSFIYGLCDTPQRILGHLESGFFDVETATRIFGIPASQHVFRELQSKKINNIEAIGKLEDLYKKRLSRKTLL
jgi:hypothetical protein